MADFEPIEIEIALNAPESIKEAAQIEGALDGLDSAVSKTESRFKAFIAEKLRSNGVSVESIKLTEREISSLKTYVNSLRGVKEMMDKTTDPTQLGIYNHKLGELQKKIDGLLTKGAAQGIASTTEKVTNQGKRVQSTKRKWDGLANSINQITREGAAFTHSAQTGFLAISNNIPILADEILRLRLQNQALTASGQTAVPVWKQVLKGFASWQTVLSIGITLLTVYGKEFVDWIVDVTKGKKQLDSFTSKVQKLNKAFRESSYTKNIKDLLELKSIINLAKKGVIAKEIALKKYNETLGKVTKQTNSLNEAEKIVRDKAPAYVRAMLYKTAATIAAADAAKKLVENQQKLFQIDVDLEKNKQKASRVKKQPTVSSVGGGVLVGNATKDALLVEELELKRKKKKLESSIKEIEQDSVKLIEGFNKKVAEIAKKFSLNLFGDGLDSKNINSRKQLLQKLYDLDKEYSRKSLTKDEEELQALRDKFDKIRKLVKAFNADPKNKAQLISLRGLNVLQNSAEKSLVYRQNTRKLSTQLDQEKQLYAAYEALKTKIGTAEADKRYGVLLKGFKSYGDRLKAEYDKLYESVNAKKPSEVTGAEKERLIVLEQRIQEFEQNQNKANIERFVNAYNSTISHKEELVRIEADYNTRKAEINKIADKNLREAKLKELDFQKKIAIDNANAEAYEKATIFEQLSVNLMDITRRELDNRIQSIEEYLRKSKGKLSKEQLAFVNGELKKAKAIKASTNLGVREKQLLQQKAAILERISKLRAKGVSDVSNELEELRIVNGELKQTLSLKLGKISGIAADLGGAFSQLGASLKDYDEGLADTFETLGDLSNVASDAVGAFASFASGDIVGGIKGAISAVAGLFSLGAKARESERKAREEIKQWHKEIFESQLAYNSELRKRISDEIRLNDLYKSRVDNIKEEIAANKKKFESIIADQQAVFDRLLKAQTTVGKKTEKYGGFLGLWKKTKVVDIKKSVSDILGISTSTAQLTDDIFDKLEKLNRDKPLTGDAKEAYEQLKKLRDEYGSLEEAQRQLQKQLKDAVTGTTAQALAESIKQGIASGKKTFADFAEDIEKFLRDAILAGMSAKIIEPEMQKLQDLLYGFLGDGVLTADEKQQFQEMYLRIAKEAQEYMDLINQTGIGIGDTLNDANSLKGAVKGITSEQANLLSGQFGGFRLTQLITNKLLRQNNASQLEVLSKQAEVQIKIEKNTRRTADNTDKLNSIDETLKDIKKGTTDNSSKANGI